MPQYEVVALLGEGGFGSVYLARQRSTRQLVALKMQRSDLDNSEISQRLSERFERETQLCASLRHPHIVQLLDRGQTDDGQLFAVYQYVPGETLKEYIQRMGPLSASAAGELMMQVLDALVCAHAHGVVHRDLKPQNIMVTLTGVRPMAKVLDFGIGTVVPSARGLDYKSLTLTSETVGTPSYSAPEQLRGEPPTIKTDLYAWALVFLECLTGAPAVGGGSLAEVFHRQLSPAPIPLPQAIAGHPLGALLRRALHKDAAQRCPTPQILWNELQAINLADLVGKISRSPDPGQARTSSDAGRVMSGEIELESKKRQITVLCCRLPTTTREDSSLSSLEANLEQRESDLRARISECVDIATRYGGFVVGTLADRVLVYFGYPLATDSDSPRALRAGVEMRERFGVREADRASIHDGVRIGIHSGLTIMGTEALSTGVTSSIAMRLENIAPADEIVVSGAVARRLGNTAEFEPMTQDAGGLGPSALDCHRYVGQLTMADSGPTRLSEERPMVGRQAELAKMGEAWTQAQRGIGSLWLITGEAGIGKSRLLRALRQAVDTEPWWCRCLPEQLNSALFPVLELMRAKLDIPRVDADLDARGRLERALEAVGVNLPRVMPIFCAWLSLPLGDEYYASQLAPPLQKSELLDAIATWILARASRKPLLLVFEDLHWVDPTTRELLERLAAEASRHPLLLVTTARPEFECPWGEQTERVTLEGLDREFIANMTDLVLEGRRLADDVVELIVERTDGIPLFVEELVRMLLDTHLVEVDGVLVLAPGTDLSTIPSSVRDSLIGRLDRLGSASHTAQLAAAIGREFTGELLMAATTTTREEAEQDLQSLSEADLLVRGSDERDSYLFRHALIRDAAYDMLTSAGRRRVHSQIAQALQQHFPDTVRADPGLLAGHLFEAGEQHDAIDYGIRATSIALEQSAFDEAITGSHKLLRWIAELPEAERVNTELTVNSLLTPSLMNKYGWAAKELGDTASRSLELLRSAGDSPYRVPTMWWVVMNKLVAGTRGGLAELTAELRSMAQSTDDPGAIAATEALVGYYDYSQGDCAAGSRAMQAALDCYDPKLHRASGATYGFDTRAWAFASLARVTWDMGEVQLASAHAQRGVDWAREIDHVPSLGIALMYQSIVHQYDGDKQAARQVSGELLELADQFGLQVYGAYGRLMHCWATDELAGGEESYGLLDAVKSLHAVAYFYSLLADIDAHQGRLADAIARVGRCIGLCGSVDEHYYEPHLYLRRAQYRASAPGHDRAQVRADLDTAARMAAAQGAAQIVALTTKEIAQFESHD